jgi:hypothetical protein
MAKECTCGFTRSDHCDGTHKVVKKLREQIAEDILWWHTPEDNQSGCCYGDCTHEEDAKIAKEGQNK